MSFLIVLIGTLAFAVLAPVVGCLLAGLDRKISARMQGRVGPPLLQPYYDVRKLIEKDNVSVNSTEGVYVTCALVFTLLAGGIFFSGGNLLMCVFVVTLSGLFFIVAAYSTRSPYAEIGANRETLTAVTTRADMKRDELRQRLSELGMAEIAIPKKLLYMETIPLLGNGKTSYVELDEMLKNMSSDE